MVCCGGDEKEKVSAFEARKLLTAQLPEDIDPASDIHTMLQWSSLVYTAASLREIVRDNEKSLPGNEDKENTTAFIEPELVWTQILEEDINPFDGTFLKGILQAKPIMKFLEMNKAYLTDDEGLIAYNPRGDSHVTPVIFSQLENLGEAFDSDIIEYDDEFVDGSSTELVFAIIVNRTRKRVVLVFRGSAVLKDFIVDASFFKMTPPQIMEFAGAEVDIHTGFSNYLFGQTQDEFGKNKFTQICDILKQVLSYKDESLGYDYTDYDLFLTGHSLGGGLAQLLAMTLVGSQESKAWIPTPVRCISYASPCVGDKEYYELYVDMEKKGLLRHLRITNDGDVVPSGPTMSFWQTGLNMHVQKNQKVQFKYHKNKKGMLNQFRGLASLTRHPLTDYRQNLFTEENAADVNMTTVELFDKYVDFDNENC